MWAGMEASIRWSELFPAICASWSRRPRRLRAAARYVAVRGFGLVGGEVVATIPSDGAVAPGKMGGDCKPVLNRHRRSSQSC